jgi:hypothetical protein
MEHHSWHTGVKYMLAGGTVVAAFGLLVEPQALMAKLTPPSDNCQQLIQPQAVLSRDRLSQLLTLPEQATQEKVRQVIQQPYCQLSPQSGQGNAAKREAYPLAFDPQTWLIVTYEGDAYTGYSFSFRR